MFPKSSENSQVSRSRLDEYNNCVQEANSLYVLFNEKLKKKQMSAQTYLTLFRRFKLTIGSELVPMF